jgi:ABC-type amino acid transport system permease subunit
MTGTTASRPASGSGSYPTGRLLAATGLTGAVLVALWTLLRFGGNVDPEVYQSGTIGLASSILAHVLGILGGAFLASTQRGATAPMNAYLASTVIRFLCTPLLAVSLYFALPVTPQPLLIGAGVGYLLILVADIATMLKAMAGSAGSSSAPRV